MRAMSLPHRVSRRMREPIGVLDHLLVLCTDGAAGYRKAASLVKDERVRRLLEDNAILREEVASVIGYALAGLGHPRAEHGSLAGALHRRWIDAIALVEPGDTGALLRACAQGERETIAAFASALGRTLPDDVRIAVQSQLGRVLAASAALNREELNLRDGHS